MWFKKEVESKEEEKYVCMECGHVFETGGEKRDIDKSVTYLDGGNWEKGWYCSLHIPAWDRQSYGAFDNTTSYYKEFEVDIKGKIIK